MPRRCSDVEHESMKVWATTDKHASVILLLCISNTNCGFLITFTQNRKGKLQERERARDKEKSRESIYLSIYLCQSLPQNQCKQQKVRWDRIGSMCVWVCGGSPVALPGVTHIWVTDLSLVCLLIQKVEHVLDGQREGAATVSRTEHRLEQVIHKLLKCALTMRQTWHTVRILCSTQHAHYLQSVYQALWGVLLSLLSAQLLCYACWVPRGRHIIHI